MEKTTQYKDGHYGTAILFKKDQVYLPDNTRVAKERPNSLRNKLRRNKQLHDLYCKFMSDLVVKGYVEVVPSINAAVNYTYGIYHIILYLMPIS